MLYVKLVNEVAPNYEEIQSLHEEIVELTTDYYEATKYSGDHLWSSYWFSNKQHYLSSCHVPKSGAKKSFWDWIPVLILDPLPLLRRKSRVVKWFQMRVVGGSATRTVVCFLKTCALHMKVWKGLSTIKCTIRLAFGKRIQDTVVVQRNFSVPNVPGHVEQEWSTMSWFLWPENRQLVLHFTLLEV